MHGTPPDKDAEERKRLLGLIAETLDISQAAFFDAATCDLRETTELLRLWHLITNTQDRAKALALVRAIAARA